MKFNESGIFVSEIRSSLMRNVKREKTVSIGFESDRSENKMQTMTIADSCNQDDEHQSNVSTRMSDEEEQDELQLQQQFNELLEENRRLKQKTQKKDILKRKISLLKQENESLKTAHEQQLKEAPKPDSSDANVSSENTAANKEQGVFAKSFLLTSTLGGIYIEPIDGTNGLSKVPVDLPAAANNNSMSPNSYNNCVSNTSPGSSYMFKQDKRTKTIETQTSTNFTPAPVNSSSKHNTYHYSPRVKVATTEEDEEAHRFVQEFKARRIALKLTQSDIGEELNLRAGARYGQSYISRMESIQLSTAIVLRMKPLLLKLLEEKEDERRRLKATCDFDEDEYQNDRKRKKRTNFTPEQSLLLTKYFADQPRPSPPEIDEISRKLEIDRNSVKMWFNNKRQSEKFRVQPLPTIGSISSVGSINPYANPYAAMPPSFLMSGLMSNMQNAINPIVTSASLNNLKLDYNLNNKLPNSTISLENVNLPNSQSPFVLSKDLNQLYQNRVDEPNRPNSEETKNKLTKDLSQLYQNSLNNAVCSNLKKGDSPNDKHDGINTSFSLASQPPFMFNKELSTLYQNRPSSEDSPTQKMSNDLAQLYKDRVVGDTNGNFNLSGGSPPRSVHMPTIKSVSPSRNPAFSLSQNLISRTLSQAIATQDLAEANSPPKFSRTP